MRSDADYSYHRGGYDDYDHSDEEVYIYDQCCKNCRYFRQYEAGSVCTNENLDEFDSPADNGSDWCEYWEGRGCRGGRR